MSTETIHIFGEHKNLQGIASNSEQVKNDEVAVLLLNAGVIHKVGPFNLNIDLSKKLSACGFRVFRFDLAGLGDSPKLKTGQDSQQLALADINQAMSHVETQFGVHKFILIGLCTGADHAFNAGVNDDRVVGNVWLDGYGYPTFKFKMKRYLPILFSVTRLFNIVKCRLFKAKKSSVVDATGAYLWKLPTKNYYVDSMQALHQRGFKSLYLFTGGVNTYYNYQEQFQDGFKDYPFWQDIEVEYYPNFDHTYVINKDRNTMIDRIALWLKNEFPCAVK